ncbi:hypothetical protein J22TS1_14630 [Siminovitchia terrae]|nr:hypothetical protein [Siminovitchia terrae]GIN90412.1 hypothetical protein J22TS1_14630 [Siminovitchia terrae]
MDDSCSLSLDYLKLKDNFNSFNFIQQKSPTSVSGEMKAYWYVGIQTSAE